MKKTAFLVAICLLLCALSLSSCQKEEEPSVWISFDLNGAAVQITNAEGKVLTLDGFVCEGDIEVLETKGDFTMVFSYRVPYSAFYDVSVLAEGAVDVGIGYIGTDGYHSLSAAATGVQTIHITQKNMQLRGSNMEYTVKVTGKNSHQLCLSGANSAALDVTYENNDAVILGDTDIAVKTHNLRNLSSDEFYLQATLPAGRKGTVLNLSDGANATLEVE